MDRFITANYESLALGIFADDLLKLKPETINQRELYNHMNKICNVSRIGPQKKTFYKLTPENRILLNPKNKWAIEHGCINDGYVKIAVAFNYDGNPECDLSKEPVKTKMDILFAELFIKSLYGKQICKITGLTPPDNVFMLDKKYWTMGFRDEAGKMIHGFCSKHGCKLIIKDADFHTKCLEALSNLEKAIGPL